MSRALRKRYGRSVAGSASIPALDALGEDGLMTFWSVYHVAGPKLAEHLFGRRFPGFTNAARALANYASNKATAMACARRGDANGVAVYEHGAKLSFDRLPEEARSVVLPAQTREAIANAVRGERYQTERAILKGWKR